MFRPLVLVVALLPLPALAQAPAEAARALILPMLQEVMPGRGGEILADCVVANATAEEIAAMAAAPGPSEAIGSLINGVLARPATTACLQAAVG